MSGQEQPRRSAEAAAAQYGDVFDVQGEVAEQAVAPGEAAMMQSMEHRTYGYITKGGPAAVMQSAANQNERAGFVGHTDVSHVVANQGVGITEVDQPGRRIMKEAIGGEQVLGKDDNNGNKLAQLSPEQVSGKTTITIGEALEATALAAGNRPVDYSDAAAIQAAEVRATGRTNIVPGGVAAAAQSAATRNARATRDEDKTKIGDILSDASSKLPSDKPVTRRDAEGVIGAEIRNDPNLCTHPGGVAASVAAAARLNQSQDNTNTGGGGRGNNNTNI